LDFNSIGPVFANLMRRRGASGLPIPGKRNRSTVMPDAVDEKGRRAVDAAAYAAHKIAAHLFLYWPVSSAFRRAVSGSPSSAPIRKIVGMLSLLWFSKRASCLSQNRPAAPESSALSAAISACGCISVTGKWRKTNCGASLKKQLHLVDDGMRHPAMRAFVIAVFNKRDRRLCRCADMITLRDRRFQGGSHVRLPDLRAFRGRQEFHRRRD
jgi:hypothetical protein